MLQLRVTRRQIPSDDKVDVSTLPTEAAVVERDDYDAALAVARAETPGGWQMIALRVDR